MTSIALTTKAAKLMKLCEVRGFKTVEALLVASVFDSTCPAICMTEGCDRTSDVEPDQQEGHCEACGGTTVMSGLVLAGLG